MDDVGPESNSEQNGMLRVAKVTVSSASKGPRKRPKIASGPRVIFPEMEVS